MRDYLRNMAFSNKKLFNRISAISTCMGLLLSFSLSAQETSLFIEEVPISEEAIKAEPELKKTTCYRVWLVLPDSVESLLAIFGSSEYPLEIKSTERFWQCSYGDFMGSNINSGLMQVHPQLIYDSWITIGMMHNRSAGNMYFLESPEQAWTTAFEDGEALVINDRVGGSWFSLPGQQNVLPTEGRVLIGQFTTAGKLELTLNCQMKDKNNEAIRIHGLKANS